MEAGLTCMLAKVNMKSVSILNAGQLGHPPADTGGIWVVDVRPKGQTSSNTPSVLGQRFLILTLKTIFISKTENKKNNNKFLKMKSKSKKTGLRLDSYIELQLKIN